MLDGDGRPFHDAPVRPARPDEVAAWLDRTRPRARPLPVGELALAPGVPFELDAGGFGRHTFLCGQSGSGKTYSLGVLLERLLMETSLRVVVLDPNSDYVRLGEPRAGADASARGAVRARSPARSRCAARHRRRRRVRVRFRELSPEQQAAVLRLDPLADREEYAELTALVEDEGAAQLRRPRARRVRLDPAARAQPRRRPLGHLARPGWRLARRGARGPGRAALPCRRPRLARRRARSRPSRRARVLERLWRRRAAREPVAIVIDEAHNVCPAEPADPIAALATEDAIRIAGEGRKFGLYLILVDPAAAEGPRERAVAVRQPRPDADELHRGPRARRRASSRSCRPA